MSVVTHDYRYTDRDVREDPRLAELAMAYLRTYGGEFEPLIEAKTYLRVVGPELPTAMVRKTLNCMRHDFNVADRMPVPRRAEVDFDRLLPTQQPVTPAQRRPPFRLRSVWKVPYLISTSKQASVYHLVDPLRSSIMYYPEAPEGSQYRVSIRAYCPSSSYQRALVFQAPEDRTLCKTCPRVQQERAERAQR